MNKNTRIKLNDGLTMPVVALGVWQSHEGTKNAVLNSIKKWLSPYRYSCSLS